MNLVTVAKERWNVIEKGFQVQKLGLVLIAGTNRNWEDKGIMVTPTGSAGMDQQWAWEAEDSPVHHQIFQGV